MQRKYIVIKLIIILLQMVKDVLEFKLTDTGEDSKLVHRRKRSKLNAVPPRYLILEFSPRPSDEYDSAPSRKYSRPLLDVFA